MTQQKDGTTYFLYLAKEGETEMPSSITVTSHQPAKGSMVTLLGHNGVLKWTPQGEGFVVNIPKSIRKNPPSDHVWTIKVAQLE
jgi:alpha-L-fucosidase